MQNSKSNYNFDWIGFAILFVIATLASLFRVKFATTYFFPFAPSDEVYWYQASRAFYLDGQLSNLRFPSGYLFPFLTSFFWSAPTQIRVAVEITQSIFFSIPAFLIFLFAKDRKLAPWVATLSLFVPAQILSILFQAENSLWFFTFAAFLLLFISMKRESSKFFTFALVAFFALPMAKASGFFTVASFLFWYGVLFLWGNKFGQEEKEQQFLKSRRLSVVIFFLLFVARYFLANGHKVVALGPSTYGSFAGQMLEVRRYFRDIPYLLKLTAGHFFTIFMLFGGGVFSFFQLLPFLKRKRLLFLYLTLIFSFFAHVAFSVLFSFIASQPSLPGEYNRLHLRYYVHVLAIVYLFGIYYLNQWQLNRKQKIVAASLGLVGIFGIAIQFLPLQFHTGSLIDSPELLWLFFYNGALIMPFITPTLLLTFFLGVQMTLIFFKKQTRTLILVSILGFCLIDIWNFQIYENFGRAQLGLNTVCLNQLKTKVAGVPYQPHLALDGPDVNQVSSILFSLGTLHDIQLGNINPKDKGFYLSHENFHPPYSRLLICSQ